MAEKITPISRAISDVLTGAYTKKRLTQEQIAKTADMSPVTLQKKLRARAPISATDLVVLAQAIGVDPGEVLDEALADLANAERLTSEGVASISEHRRKKSPADMTDDELEALRSVAKRNDELEHDEPDAP